MSQEILDFLLQRRSTKAAQLTEPGPTAAQLQAILTAAARVPDHKKLEPWRFIVFAGEARVEAGKALAGLYERRHPDAAPKQIGTFKTPNASGSKDVNAGDYTIHNPLLVGSTLYISWYTDGIRVVDARDPRKLSEVAHFVPPAVNNPIQPSQRGTLTNATQVWGVAYDDGRDLIYASDMNSGLWILRRTDR